MSIIKKGIHSPSKIFSHLISTNLFLSSRACSWKNPANNKSGILYTSISCNTMSYCCFCLIYSKYLLHLNWDAMCFDSPYNRYLPNACRSSWVMVLSKLHPSPSEIVWRPASAYLLPTLEEHLEWNIRFLNYTYRLIGPMLPSLTKKWVSGRKSKTSWYYYRFFELVWLSPRVTPTERKKSMDKV